LGASRHPGKLLAARKPSLSISGRPKGVGYCVRPAPGSATACVPHQGRLLRASRTRVGYCVRPARSSSGLSTGPIASGLTYGVLSLRPAETPATAWTSSLQTAKERWPSVDWQSESATA